jgi:hypothetical protein
MRKKPLILMKTECFVSKESENNENFLTTKPKGIFTGNLEVGD